MTQNYFTVQTLAEVARLLGTTERMVERVYGKHAPSYLKRAVGVLRV